MENKVCGIYMIRNLVNNKVYIGQSIDIYERWNEHICALRGEYHANNHLQSSWNKYKECNFEFSIIEECDESELNNKEIFWIAENDSYYNGYNQTKGGGGIRGFKHSDETKAKISVANKGENNFMYGKHHSYETKQKISVANKGKCVGDKNPMYGDHRFAGENNPNYGKRLSEKTKTKISNALIGQFAGENNPRARAVYCIELDEFFLYAKEAFEKYDIDHSNIIKCCKGKQGSAGRHPQTGEKLHWIYVDKMNNSSIA